MILAYRYRIKDRSARKVLRRHAYAVNQVWNWCVAQQRDIEDRYRAGSRRRKWATHFDLAKSCKGVGADLGIYQKTVECVCAQFASNRDSINHAPRFRASGGSKRALGWVPFRSPRLDGNSIIYLGRRFRFWQGRRPLPEIVKGGVFVEDSMGRWFVSFHVDVEVNRQSGVGQVGVDLGLKTFAACSDAHKIESPRVFRSYERRLATAQRAGNRRRANAIHARIKNARRDFIHKITTGLVRENNLIAVGDVDASRLGKTRFAKSVYDASWSMLRAQLRYKCQQAKAVYVDIDEKFTTRECSSCGAMPGSSPKGMGALGIRVWECSCCGASHDRDVNAAKNILALALSAQRRGDESRLLATTG